MLGDRLRKARRNKLGPSDILDAEWQQLKLLGQAKKHRVARKEHMKMTYPEPS